MIHAASNEFDLIRIAVIYDKVWQHAFELSLHVLDESGRGIIILKNNRINQTMEIALSVQAAQVFEARTEMCVVWTADPIQSVTCGKKSDGRMIEVVVHFNDWSDELF
jgi:hypothetical protein